MAGISLTMAESRVDVSELAEDGGELPSPPPLPVNSDCEERVRALQAQFDALLGRSTNLFHDLNTIRGERDQALEERDDAIAAVEAARNGANNDCPEQLRQTQTARDVAVQALDTALEERNQAIGDVQEITENLTAAQAEIQRLLESAQLDMDVAVAIQTKLNARDVELQNCNEGRTAAEAEIARLTRALEEEQNGAVEAPVNNGRDAELQDCVASRTTAQTEVERLTNELQAADDVAAALRTELAEALADSLASQNAKAAAEAEFDRVTTEIADLVRQIEELEGTQGDDCEVEVERLNGLLAAANEEIVGLRAIRDMLAGLIRERAPELDERVRELEGQIRNSRGERDGCNEAANRKLRLLRDCLKAGGRARRSDAPSPNNSSSEEEEKKTTNKGKKSQPKRKDSDSSIDVKSDDSRDLDYQPPGSKKRKAAKDDENKKSRKRR